MTKSTSPLGATGERLRPSGRSGVVQVFRVLTATTSDRWIATSVAGEVEVRTAVPKDRAVCTGVFGGPGAAALRRRIDEAVKELRSCLTGAERRRPVDGFEQVIPFEELLKRER